MIGIPLSLLWRSWLPRSLVLIVVSLDWAVVGWLPLRPIGRLVPLRLAALAGSLGLGSWVWGALVAIRPGLAASIVIALLPLKSGLVVVLVLHWAGC